MNLDFHPKFKNFEKTVDFALSQNPSVARALRGCEISMGPANDNKYGVPGHAQDAIFVGDSAWIGDKICPPQVEAMFARDPSKVSIKPQYNKSTGKWDQLFTMAGDEFPATEPTPGFITGQTWSPWNISYLSKVFKEPLAYTNVDQYIRYESGNNPWAEIFTLFMEQYTGWGMVGETGSLQNIQTADVNFHDGFLSVPVVNLSGTYSLTLEETVRPNPGPVPGSPQARKQEYLNYVLRMIEAQIALFGNNETDTNGLIDIPNVVGDVTGGVPYWPGFGLAADGTTPLPSLNSVWKDATAVTKGTKIYYGLADVILNFLTEADNKFRRIVLVVSPLAYNIFRMAPYSDVYNPMTSWELFAKDFLAGKGPGGDTPSIEVIVEPLFKANTTENPNILLPGEFGSGATANDAFAILAPEMPAGPLQEAQPSYMFAAPLRNFVFPAIPGMYNTQYKTLRRFAGCVATMKKCVKIYKGLGLQDGA